MLESQGSRLEAYKGRPELLQERNLDVSTDELLSAERAFTHVDLYAMQRLAVLPICKTITTDSVSMSTVKIFLHWLAQLSIYWRFAILFFDC
jgi:hypothetical protein